MTGVQTCALPILLIETGEEVGSPGLRTLCEQQRERFRADVFIASDGPRL